MKKCNLFLLALCILSSFTVFSQHSISGVVKDTLNNPVFGAVVRIENTYQAVFTNPDGAYELSNLSDGIYKVSAEILGKEKVVKAVVINGSNVTSDFLLKVSPFSLDAVSVEATRVKENAPIVTKPIWATEE